MLVAHRGIGVVSSHDASGHDKVGIRVLGSLI